MAKKSLSKEMLAELAKMGITNVNSDEEANKVLLEKLSQHEINGLEGEDTQSLMQYYESFAEEVVDVQIEDSEDEDEQVEETEETELDELAEEVKEEAEKKHSENEKKRFTGSKNIIKTEQKKNSKEVIKSSKNVNKSKNSKIKFESSNNEQLCCLDQFRDKFPENNYEIGLLKNGISIRQLLKSKKKVILSYDKLSIDENGRIISGVLFFDCLKGIDEVAKYVDKKHREDKKVRNYTMNLVTISPINQDEFNEIINDDFIQLINDRMLSFDKKLQKNRESLEEKMKKTKTVEKKITPKKESLIPQSFNKTIKKKIVLKKK